MRLCQRLRRASGSGSLCSGSLPGHVREPSLSTRVCWRQSTFETPRPRSYRDVSGDHAREFKRLQVSIERKRESAELLQRTSKEGGRGDDGEMETLLRERSSINSSQRMTGDLLGQASETREELRAQR